MKINDALGTDIAHVGDMMATSGGDLATISGLPNFIRSLFHRLITVPGSLAHRPGYGVGVGNYQNGLGSFAKQQKLAAAILDQFSQDPRVSSVTSVAVIVNDTHPEQTVIRVAMIPVGYTEQTINYTPFNLGLS